jgi:hypothetical protein
MSWQPDVKFNEKTRAMSDDFETVRVDLTYNHRDSLGHEDALEALDRIEARLSTAEKALKRIAGLGPDRAGHAAIAHAALSTETKHEMYVGGTWVTVAEDPRAIDRETGKRLSTETGEQES